MSAKISTIKNKKSASTGSLAFTKTTDSSKIQFPLQDTYYTYRPPKPDASLFQRALALLSLYYYKYLLHSGIYVMTKNERRLVNSVVVLSVILSMYQVVMLLLTLFTNE